MEQERRSCDYRKEQLLEYWDSGLTIQEELSSHLS